MSAFRRTRQGPAKAGYYIVKRELHAWLSTRLDGAARASVEEAMRDTVAELAMDELDTPALAALGMPSRPERGALVDLLDRHVFRAAA